VNVRNITQQKEQEQGFRLDLGSYTRILWRKKYFLLVPLAIAFIVASIGVRFLVPEYESSSVIRIGNSNNVSNEVNTLLQGRGKRDRETKTLLQLEADILGSKFLDELIRRLGLDRDPEVIARAELQHQNYPALSTEELVFRRLRDSLKRRIKVEAEAEDLFRVSYADPNPDACFVISDAMTQLYIDMQSRQTMQSLGDVRQFSEEQLAVYKERLDRSEKELSSYQENLATRNVATANPVDNTNVALSEKTRNDLALTVRASESTLQKIRNRISGAMGSMPSGDPILRDPEVSKLSAELSERREGELLLEISHSASGSRLTTEMDPVLVTQQALQRRLQQVSVDVYPDVPEDYRPLLVEYYYQQCEVRAYRQKLQRLDSYIGQFRSQVSSAPQTETELSRLRDEVERNREVYNTFKEGKAQAEIGEDAQKTRLGSTVFIVEAASKPVVPVRPDKIKILAFCFLFGATVGAAGLLLTEFTDSSYRSVDDVEKQLGMRVLGTIPRVGNARWVSEKSRKRTVIWVAVCVTFVCVFIGAFYFYGKSSREQMIDLNPAVTTSNTEAPGR
jgi:polysaccharide biosynthesis transport protein